MLPFDDRTKFLEIEDRIKEVGERGENVRKGLFARHTEMMRIMLNQQEEIEVLKARFNDLANHNVGMVA
jgi:hypothetical protein